MDTRLSQAMRTCLDAARYYAEKRWSVFPLHSVHSNGSCTCDNPQCRSPGKHPCTPQGLKAATTDDDKVLQLFRNAPRGANVAIATGKRSGLVVLDVGKAPGGFESLQSLKSRHGPVSTPLRVDTGGGGRHLYFSDTGRLINCSVSKLGRGLDVRGDGGYVVAPPSLHATGMVYRWASRYALDGFDLDPVPAWLVRLLESLPALPTSQQTETTDLWAEGCRNQKLMSEAGRLRRSGSDFEQIQSVLAGLNLNRCAPPLFDKEVTSIAKSCMRYAPDKDEEVLLRLAAAPPLEYERLRKQEAQLLGVSVGALDREVKKRAKAARLPDVALSPVIAEAEPWPSTVCINELISELCDLFGKHLALEPPAVVAIALWVIFTHVDDAFQTSPILALTSPERRCGKTTALSLLLGIVRRPLAASNVTPAAIFRAVHQWQPTLLVDEADTFIDGKEELRGVLNSGHQRSFASVLRCVGDEHEPTLFKTWCPKAIAKIGLIDATLQDRSIRIVMRRKNQAEPVKRIEENTLALLVTLASRCARWAVDNMDALKTTDPESPKLLHDRMKDNWRPLLAIASLAKDPWPQRAAEAAGWFAIRASNEDSETASTLLLRDISWVFDQTQQARITSQSLAESLRQLEHRPWPEWQHGRPITPRQIAQLLRPFEISPKSIRMSSVGTPKGYEREQFQDAFCRYIDP